MNILDIDQDFFWIINDINKNEKKYFQKDDFIKFSSFNQIANLFNLHKAIPHKIFIDHDEVYYHIKCQNLKEVKLIHLDRHDDLDREKYNVNHITMGNWITYLIRDGICNQLDWIHNRNLDNAMLIINEAKNKCAYNICDLKTYIWDKTNKIDYIYFTISPEFVANNSEFDSFVYFMKNFNTNERWL